MMNDVIRLPPCDDLAMYGPIERLFGENESKNVLGYDWTFIVYPEECKCDFLLALQYQHVPCLVSPLHDPKLNADNDPNEPKKVHYHVMWAWRTNKTKRQVTDMVMYLRYLGVACTLPQKVSGKFAMEDYFCHIGYPRKQQFPSLDYTTLCGYVLKYRNDVNQVMPEIFSFIKQTGVCSYWSLMDYAIENRPDWVIPLTNKAYSVNQLLKSYGGTVKYEQQHQIINREESFQKVAGGVRSGLLDTSKRVRNSIVPQDR